MPTGSTPQPGPLKPEVMDSIALWRSSSKVDINISPVPYNAATDGQVELLDMNFAVSRKLTDTQDLAWERKRGTKEYEDWKQQQLEALELVLAGDNKKGGASSSPTSQDDQKGGNSKKDSGSGMGGQGGDSGSKKGDRSEGSGDIKEAASRKEGGGSKDSKGSDSGIKGNGKGNSRKLLLTRDGGIIQ